MKSVEGLQEYLDFVLWHYKVVDGFWFLAVSEAMGQQKAGRLSKQSGRMRQSLPPGRRSVVFKLKIRA